MPYSDHQPEPEGMPNPSGPARPGETGQASAASGPTPAQVTGWTNPTLFGPYYSAELTTFENFTRFTITNHHERTP